jgi:hypothetical protein
MSSKGNTIITRLTRGAAATSVIGGVVFHAGEMAAVTNPERPVGAVSSPVDAIPRPSDDKVFVTDTMPFKVAEHPEEWTKRLEKEFHALAAKEVRGKLSRQDYLRLEELNFWRDTLKVPRTPQEILLQIQRDRVVDKLSEALEEYVQFQKSSREAGRVS